MRHYLTAVRGPPSNSLQTINAGEGVEQRETAYTDGSNVNWAATVENRVEDPYKTKNSIQQSHSWAYV